jgi:AraC-like DNA-binding protein
MASAVDAVDVAVNDYALHVPAAPLRPFVTGWTGYRQAGQPAGVHRGLPSPFLTVIFTLDDPLVIAAHPDPGQRPGSFLTLVGGLHTSPALIAYGGRQSGIQLAVTPLGARALLNMPAGELAGIDAHGSDVLGREADQIQERLRELPGWPERFAFLEQWLLDRLWAADERAGVSREVGYAWEQLVCSGGTATVSRLADETGWSERHLRARFRLETGLGPKEAGRVIRFDRARRELQRRAAGGRPLALADIAAAAGYFDQAHLNRDFRDLAGCPPTTWLADEFRNVQAAPPGPPAE